MFLTVKIMWGENMRTLNTVYSDTKQLIAFFREKAINTDMNIFIQIFSGIVDRAFLRKVIDEILILAPNAKILGTTSYGEICHGTACMGSCVISVSEFEKTTVETYIVPIKDRDYYNSSLEMGRIVFKENPKAVIVFAADKILQGPDVIDGEKIIAGINAYNKNTVIAGGIAGNPDSYEKMYVFTETAIMSQGIAAAALASDSLIATNDSKFSWRDIGRDFTVTESQGNLLKTIEDLPAWVFYKKYMGEDIGAVPHFGAQFPFLIQRNGKQIANPIIQVDPPFCKDALMLLMKVHDGEKIKFGYGNKKDILNDVNTVYTEHRNTPLESVFIYSCVSRLHLLKKVIQDELKPFGDGDKLTGCFCSGEFNYIDGESLYFTETLTILGLSENESARIEYPVDHPSVVLEKDNKEETILYNLVKETTREVNDLNRRLEYKVEEKVLEIKKIAYNDQLTGLFNRRRLIEDIDPKRRNKLALFDIKNFSYLNDFYGNKIGDEILKILAYKMNSFFITAKFTIYRLNADLFAVLGSESLNEKWFVEGVRQFHRMINQNNFIFYHFNIKVNMVTSVVCDDGDALEKAEVNLRNIKNEKSGFRVYDSNSGILEKYKGNLICIEQLKKAVWDDRVVPYFQPIVNNKTGKVEKYEALIRMINEKNEILMPEYFLEAARNSDIYHELTRIMIDKSFDTFKDIKAEFAINLLLTDILNKETTDLIFRRLEKMDPGKAVFEIVETEGIEEFEEVKTFISEIRKRGAKIAIDDFGTGYSNFEYLLNMNVDYLKIDGSLIQNICSERNFEIMAETIVNFSSRLGIKTIGEFVSEKIIHDKVVELGIDYSQGYYFSKPISLNTLKKRENY